MNHAPASGTPRNVILCGGTSAVAVALGRRLAARGWNLHLLGRDAARLEDLAADLRVRGAATASCGVFDAADMRTISGAYRAAVAALPGPLNGLIVCHGALANETGRLPDGEEIERTVAVNFTSVAYLLTLAAGDVAQRPGAFLAAVSSVAGDRGRQSNFCYGAAKAGLSAWLSGLRNRLHRSGVRVLTIKPGIIDSPMTHGLAVGPKALITTPDVVAADIERAILRGRDVTYTPWFWWPIMAAIRAIPEPLFKRMRL